MLHLRGPRVSPSRVGRALQTLQTSSPSYLLLASLDAATAHAQHPEAFDVPLATAWAARAGISHIQGLTLVDASTCEQHLYTGLNSQQAPGTHRTEQNGPSHSQQQQQKQQDSRGIGGGGDVGADGSIFAFDPLRFAVNVSGLGISGFKASTMLEEEWGVVSELSTAKVGPLIKQIE